LQVDLQEKNHQVKLMRSIYESAQQVVVYLGEPDGDSNKAISTVEKQASRLRAVGFSFE
jgi:hypothetical protein